MTRFRGSLLHRRFLIAAVSAGCAVTAAFLVSPGSAAAGSVGAGVSQHCRGAFNPYQVRQSLLAPCGEHVIPLVAERPLPGGGRVLIYGSGSLQVRRPIPPTGFDPVMASAARLAEYDFPPRPSGGRALNSWLDAMRKARPAEPTAYLVGGAADRRIAPDYTEYASEFFAGNVAIDETYTNVYADWVEPSITTADCPSPQEESTWAGIGGGAISATGALMQAGTQYGEGSGLANHEAFIQGLSPLGDLNGGAPIALNVTATVGGVMYVNIFRASSAGYNVYVENEYTGQAWTGGPFVAWAPYDGGSAEFIVEDPNGGLSGSGPPVYLIRFGTFEVEDAEASINDSTFEGLASWPHDDVEMVNSGDNNNLLAYPGPAFNSGDSWYDYHENCY
jgi:hypothetical protein